MTIVGLWRSSPWISVRIERWAVQVDVQCLVAGAKKRLILGCDAAKEV